MEVLELLMRTKKLQGNAYFIYVIRREKVSESVNGCGFTYSANSL